MGRRTCGRKRPEKFGNVWLDKTVAEENGVYYPYMAVADNKPLFDKNTLEYADNISWISDNMKYVSLIAGDNTADETFKAKICSRSDRGGHLSCRRG